MQISNRKIINDFSKLEVISQKQLPIKASYAIAKNMNKLESEISIYNKERAKLIEKYADKNEDGTVKADEKGTIIFKEEFKECWDKEINELMDIENEIDIHKFNISLLDEVSMTAAELRVIEYMIEE